MELRAHPQLGVLGLLQARCAWQELSSASPSPCLGVWCAGVLFFYPPKTGSARGVILVAPQISGNLLFSSAFTPSQD